MNVALNNWFSTALPFTTDGKWWFGNRIKTKDGVQAGTAEMFFKSIKEDSGVEDLLAVLAQAYDTEGPPISARVGKLQEAVRSRLGGKFLGSPTQTLLYAYLLRIPIEDTKLQKGNKPSYLITIVQCLTKYT